MKTGFIYLWYDKKRKLFYLGSHLGQLDDGYIGSNFRLKNAVKKRPETFKRKILQFFPQITSKQLLEKEQQWLNLIKPEELHGVRYYNEKRVAAGGDIVGSLTIEKKQQHSRKSGVSSRKYWDNISPEDYEKRCKNAFGGNKFDRSYMSERNKKLCSRKALIKYADGNEIEITNVAEFCRINSLNYGNFKNMLRGLVKTCKGFKGNYI